MIVTSRVRVESDHNLMDFAINKFVIVILYCVLSDKMIAPLGCVYVIASPPSSEPEQDQFGRVVESKLYSVDNVMATIHSRQCANHNGAIFGSVQVAAQSEANNTIMLFWPGKNHLGALYRNCMRPLCTNRVIVPLQFAVSVPGAAVRRCPA